MIRQNAQRTDWYSTFEHLKTNICPFAYWLKSDTTIYKRLSEISSPCLERVGSDGHRSLHFVGFDKFYRLFNQTRSSGSSIVFLNTHLSHREQIK